MHKRISEHIRSNIVGYVAVFIALSGTAYAVDGPLAGQNQVGSEDIINGEVKNADLGADSIGSAKILDRQVKNADLSIGASSSNTIADGGILGVDVKNDTLTGAQVDESTLTGVIQGNGRAADMQQAIPPGFVSGTPTMVPNFFDVDYSCGDFNAPNPLDTNGTIHLSNYRNKDANLFIDNGTDTPQFTALGPTPSSTSVPAFKGGELVTFQLQWSDGAMATIWVSSVHRASDCHFQVQALVTD